LEKENLRDQFCGIAEAGTVYRIVEEGTVYRIVEEGTVYRIVEEGTVYRNSLQEQFTGSVYKQHVLRTRTRTRILLDITPERGANLHTVAVAVAVVGTKQWEE